MAVPKQSSTVEDEEETISLCDLPIYSADSNCDHYSNTDSLNNNDDTFFEFFSHDFSVSDSVNSRSDNLIFCGKLIPIDSDSISSRNRQIRTNAISNRECMNRKRSRKMELPAAAAAAATRSVWFLFLFGGAGIGKEMELSDMRTRQRRRVPPAMLRPAEGGGRKKKTVGGLWRVVRALVMGCTSSDRNVALRDSFTPIPFQSCDT